jgi:hypothetical protein
MRKQSETDPVSLNFASKRKNILCETGAPYTYHILVLKSIQLLKIHNNINFEIFHVFLLLAVFFTKSNDNWTVLYAVSIFGVKIHE